jgi:hypothetical protein
MSYTILSAAWADAGNTAATLQTQEAAEVLAHQGHPAAWAAFQTWLGLGNTPSAYVPPDLNAGRRARALRIIGSDDGPARALLAIANLTRKRLNLIHEQVVARVTATYDPPSMANNAGAAPFLVTATGAQFGDSVDVAAPYSLAGVTCTGYVHAANQAAIKLFNSSGATANLASGTWTVTVRRPAVLPQLTRQQVYDAIVDEITNWDA